MRPSLSCFAAVALAACSISLGSGAARATDAGSTPGNLLLITLDTTRADALGIYGQALPSSPEIDRLAREGVVFDQAMTTNPETLPAHASLFTGLYPFRHGVRRNGAFVLPKASITLAEILKEHGYRTHAEIASDVLGGRTRIAQGFEKAREVPRPAEPSASVQAKKGPPGASGRTRIAEDVAGGGIEFLESVGDDPFFLWLHFYDPHLPHSPPERFSSRLPESPYHAEVAYMDAQIGRVLRVLRDTKLSDRTTVVIWGDHGESLGEHGEARHGVLLYDATMRIPLIVWRGDARIPGGRRVRAVVRSIDVLPTALELLGLPAIEDSDGSSLAPLLAGEKGGPKRVAYGESLHFLESTDLATLRFVREGRWKYIHKVNPELYDVSRDPDELDDRIRMEPGVAARMRQRLGEILEVAGDAPEEARSVLDPQLQQSLALLGYVPPAEVGSPIALADDLRLPGIDPNPRVEDVVELRRAMGFLRHDQPGRALELLGPVRARHAGNPLVERLLGEAAEQASRESEPGVPLPAQAPQAESGERAR